MIRLKVSEAINAYNAIQALLADGGEGHSTAFNYALLRNRRTLETIVQQYNADLAAQRDDVLDRLLAEWAELAAPYAKRENGQIVRDSMGNPMIVDERVAEYNAACEALLVNKDYADAVERRTHLIAELHAHDVDADVYALQLNEAPANLPLTTLEALYPLIG